MAAQQSDVKARIKERIKQRVQERIQQKQADRSETPQLPPPPSGLTLDRVKDWVFSKEGGGATLARLGGDIGGSIAGAKVGATVGAPFGPVGMGVGAVGGAILGGAAGGYAGETAGQALEGRSNEPTAERERKLAAAAGALPLGLGKAKTAGKWAIKAAREGAGAGAAYSAGHQTYVEGKPVGDIDLPTVGKSAAVGGVVGGVMGRMLPSTKTRDLPAPPGRRGLLERVIPPRDPSLTPEAAHAASSKAVKQAIKQKLKTAKEMAKVGPPRPKGRPRTAPDPAILGPQKPKAAKPQPSLEERQTAKAVATQKEAEKVLKEQLGILDRDVRTALGPDDLERTQTRNADRIMAQAKKVLAGKGGSDEFEAINRELAGLGLGGDRLTAISDMAPRHADQFAQNKAIAQLQKAAKKTKQPKLSDLEKARRAALKKVDYTATRNGERAAKAKAEKLNELYPDADARASRVVEYVGKGKARKAKVRGWRVTSKYTREKLKAKAALVVDPLKPTAAPPLGPAKPVKPTAKLGRQIGREMAEEGPPTPRQEEQLAEEFEMGQMPEELEALLGGGDAQRAAIESLPTQRPKGSTPEDWVAIPVGTKELSQDFAVKVKNAGHDVWVEPGTKYKKYTVHVPKDVDVSDLASEYGVGRRSLPSPWEQLPRSEGYATRAKIARPDQGVKLKSEEARAKPGPVATIGDALEAKGQLLPKSQAALDQWRQSPAGRSLPPPPPIDQAALKRQLIPPTGKERVTPDTVGPTPEMRTRASKLTDDQLKKASANAKDPRIRQAAEDELRNRPSFLKRLAEDETGSLKFWKSKADQIDVLPDEKGLNKILDDQQADLASIGQPKSRQGYLNQKLTRWFDEDWNLRVRVNEAIADGHVWDAEHNPLWQARLHKGGRTADRIALDWGEMMDAYQEVRKAGLERPFLKYMNLSINARSEATAIQHVTNARKGLEAAELALARAMGQGAKKKVLKSLRNKLRFAQKRMQEADAEWGRVESGRGLQGGYKPGESEALLKRVEQDLGPENYAKVKESAEVFARLHDDVLQDAVDTGMVSPELAAQYRARGEYVAPMMRLTERAQDIAVKKLESATNQGLLGVSEKQAQVLMKFQGETRSAKHPVTASMLHLSQVVRQNAENQLAKNFVDEFRQIEKYKPWIQKVTAGAKIEDPDLAKIPIWRNGREEWWTLPRDLAEITANPGRLQLEMMGLGPMRVLKGAKTLLTKSATTWRPAFLFGRNPWRDIGESRFNLPEVYTIGDPVDYQRHVAEYVGAVRQLLKDPRGLNDPSIRAFRKSGAGMSTLQRSMMPQQFVGKRQLDQLARMGRKLEGGMARQVKEELGEVIDWLDTRTADGASAMEMASKLVSWRRLKEKGYSDDAAAYLVRTYGGSPDFAVGGEMKPYADLMLMFFNPALRGIEQTGMAIKRLSKMPAVVGEPTEAMKKGMSNAFDAQEASGVLQRILRTKGPSYLQRALGTMAAATVAQAMWNNEYIDEEGVPYIERIPAWVRNNNYVIFTPFGPMIETEAGPMPHYITIAKPHSRVLLQSPIEKAVQRFLYGERSEFTGGTDGTAQFIQGIAGDMVESASPIRLDLGGGNSVAEDIVSGLSATANPVIGASIDLARNVRSTGGGPIVGRREMEALPEDRYTASRSRDTTTKVTKQLNEIARDKLGLELGIAPAQVEYVIQRMAPGVHALAGSTAEGIREVTGGGPARGSEFNELERLTRVVPVAGDVMRAIMGPTYGGDARLRELKDQFYRYADKAKQRYGSATLKVEREGLEAAREYYRAAPPEQQWEVKKAFDRAIMELAKAHRQRGKTMIALMDEKDPERQAKLKEDIQRVNRRELAYLKRWRTRMDEIEGKT